MQIGVPPTYHKAEMTAHRKAIIPRQVVQVGESELLRAQRHNSGTTFEAVILLRMEARPAGKGLGNRLPTLFFVMAQHERASC